MSPDSVHGGGERRRGGGEAGLTEDVKWSKLSYGGTQTAPAKADRRKVSARKVSSPGDRWRLLIGLSITLLLRSSVVEAGLMGSINR